MLSMLARYRSSCSSLMGNRNGLRRATLPEHRRAPGVRYGPPTMDQPALPVLFFDGGLPDVYHDLDRGAGDRRRSRRRRHRACATRAIAGGKRAWNASVFTSCPRLRVVSRVGVGYDNVNLADAAAAGVVVCYAPTGADRVDRRAHDRADAGHHQATAAAASPSRRPGCRAQPPRRSLELDGATLGLVGLGRIASRVASPPKALGDDGGRHDPYIEESPVPGVGLVALDAMLPLADVVSLHAPAFAVDRAADQRRPRWPG